MNTNDQPPSSEALRSTAIPIAQVSTDVDRLADKSIHSVVTLLWPYSSSTKSLSLLLAEPDFRLRRSNGQVKVLFHGHVAEEVAKTHVGIGDKVYLSLDGSRLVESNAVAQTPGSRSVWELHFDTSAFCEVWRDSNLLTIVQVDRSSSPPPPNDILATPSTPISSGNTYFAGPLGSPSWQSPAFFERSRKSFGLADTTYDPFAEEDGYVPGKGRKRPRFSMRSNEWRVIDEPESPGEKELPDWTVIFDEELATGSDASEEATAQAQDAEKSGTSLQHEALSGGSPSTCADVAMIDFQPIVPEPGTEQTDDRSTDNANFLRPDNPLRIVPEITEQIETGQVTHLPTDTPRLHPIPSPGLPAPSPLVTSNSPSGYFTPVVEAEIAVQSTTPIVSSSEIASEHRDATSPQQIQSDGEAVHVDEDDAVTVYTDDMQVLPESISPSSRTPSSLQALGGKGVASAPAADQQPGEARENTSFQDEVEAADVVTPIVHSGGPDSDSERQFENRKDEDMRVESQSSENEEESERDQGPFGRQSQESEGESESERVSDTRSDFEEYDETEEDAVEAADGEEALVARRVSQSLEWGRDASEEPAPLYDDEAQEEDEYEGEYEEDYDEEELEDKPQYEYYGSESEDESDYEEEPQPRSAPRNTEPEIIVLDSDSEDELSTQQPNDTSRREMEEDSEGSYGSEDEVEPENEIYDEPDLVEELEDQEGDEGVEDLEEEEEAQGESNQDFDEIEKVYDDNQAQNHELEGQPDNDSIGDDRSPIYERVAEEQGSENDQLYREEHDEESAEILHAPYQGQSDVEMVATSAGPPGHYEQEPTHGGSSAPYEYLENFHATADHPHDSLDYLAAISESAERIETVSESVQQTYDMAIDPSLYEVGAKQSALAQETGADDHQQSVASNGSSESPESRRARDLALQLDGASPTIYVEPTEATMSTSTTHAAKQLVTPGPSQPVEADKIPTFIETRDRVLLTPDVTQTAGEQPSTRLETRTNGVSEEGSPSGTVTVKVESTLDVPEQEMESEPEAAMAVVDPAEPTLSRESHKVQASIEIDHETEAGVDATHLSPVDRHYPGLRSKLSYFAPLATLIDHYNTLVDIISIASEVQPATKAASGKKDFMLTIQLTDPSMAGTALYAQILRPYKSALPSLQEGDAILLRNFRVKSFDHSVILVSDSTSAWAVYSASHNHEPPDVTGPPIEVGSEEKAFATDLRQWYLEGGMAMVADNQLQASIGRESREGTPDSSIAQSDAGDMDLALREVRGDTSSSRGSRRRKSHRRITIHELRDGRRYTEVGSSPGEGSIHELRDGTVYANL
ncbi:hypothetical protein BJY00DRAFT_198838 [Aspergillus carlsbadensis]|nr:hypothetical protein BJY00DRAFT_198838 [Aspergillus carlsbadensis]